MDVLYLFRHSTADDWEIRYSLRSVNLYLPWVRKVWIFGDRPAFLVDDTSRIEHVSHDYLAWIGNHRLPVTNTFLMLFLSSLLPELSSEYLWFCDDYVLLDYLSEQDARKARYLQNLDEIKNRGKGLWKEALWRTYDLLKRSGYPGLNFETHTPTHLTKRRVWEAYRQFRDFVTEDRFYGPLALTAILNHAQKTEGLDLTHLADEGRKAGFYQKPPTHEEVVRQCRGRIFLNFDDAAFGDGLKQYLAQRFPRPSIYERKTDTETNSAAGRNGSSGEAKGLEQVFGQIYRSNAWKSQETVSGRGSTVEATSAARQWLAKTCRDRGIRRIVDIGCGDWNWMRLVVPELDLDWYRGYDVVPELVHANRQRYGSAKISFLTEDVTATGMPPSDLVICRDCLTHLSYDQIERILCAVKASGARHLAATTFPGAANRNIEDGKWRPLDLSADPFGLPVPEDSVVEGTWPSFGEKRFALFSIRPESSKAVAGSG